jgi:RND family efflux transporter MFP subunit
MLRSVKNTMRLSRDLSKGFSRTAIALTALWAASCGGQQGGPPGGGAFPPAAVTLAAATTTDIEDATEYVATLKSLHSTPIQPQIDGQITKILVKSGDRVKEGQPLIQIDPRRQQAAVSSQEAARAAAEANVNFTRDAQARAHELYTAGAISKAEQDQADTAFKTAQANLEAINAQVQQQQVQLRYYTISAPTSGIVGDVPAREGNQVTTSTVLTTVDQNETLEVYVSVPVEKATSLKMGLPIQILDSDGKNRLATTSINFISPHVDDATQSILVKGAVPNGDGRFRALQFVRARVVWSTSPGITVPVTAILRVQGQNFVFVAERAEKAEGGRGGGGMVAHQRSVRLGPIVGDSYPVLEGVKAGEQVVVSGVQKLQDGAPIAPEK